MSDVSVLREQVKLFVNEASEKELKMIYHLFEATNTNDWWDEITPGQREAIDKGIKQTGYWRRNSTSRGYEEI